MTAMAQSVAISDDGSVAMASYFRGQTTTKGFFYQAMTPCDAGAVAGFTDLV
jgi:hypothetical protein